MIKITKRSKFPKCVQKFKELKGICIGGCIDENIADKHVAHAHPYNDNHQGWICLRYKYQLKEKLTLLHEVAHLIANKSDKTPFHGTRWKEAVCNIGGTYKSYSYSYSGTKWTYVDYTYRNNMV